MFAIILGTFINLGNNFTSDTLTTAGTLVGDLSPYLSLIVGVLITVLIATLIIKALKK